MVSVKLTNRFAYVDCPDEAEKQALREYWSYWFPGARFTRLYNTLLQDEDGKVIGRAWDGMIHLFTRNKVTAGLFRATRYEIATQLGIQFQVTYERPLMEALRPGFTIQDPKYSYQNDCVDAMLAVLHKGGGIILSATRTGKSIIAAAFFSKLSYDCLYVVDQVDLLDQTQQELGKWLNEEIGYVGDSQYRPARVTVATRQTLAKHLDDPVFNEWLYGKKRRFVVVVDELHEQVNQSNFDILAAVKPVARYGLTATLQLQKKEVRMKSYNFAGPVIFRFQIAEGIKRGVLTKGRCLQMLFEPAPVGGVEDYQQEYLEQVVEHEVKAKAIKALTACLIEHDRRVIVLTDRTKHLEAVSDSLMWIPHRLAYGKVAPKKRSEARAEFERGDVRLIITNKVFRKGVTLARLDAAIDCAELPGKDLAQQKFGRGIGIHQDKEDFLYIDVGTDGSNRFHRAARSRAKALRASGIEVKTVRVDTAAKAVRVLQRELKKIKAQRKPEPKQTEMVFESAAVGSGDPEYSDD
jgi:superfamily II DNA or RNA helicase